MMGGRRSRAGAPHRQQISPPPPATEADLLGRPLSPRSSAPASTPVVPPENHWRRRPFVSAGVRVAVVVVPFALSLALALALRAAMPRPSGLPSVLLWAAVILALSLLTLVLLARTARVLLPLAALLNLTLIFPDRAPRRFAVARRAGSPGDLRKRLHNAEDHGDGDEAHRLQTVVGLLLALSVHDGATRGHSERVRVLTELVAVEMGVPEDGRARLRWAALLHDIGKLEVPASVLNKKGSPDHDEWAVIHRHPEEGARLVAPLLPWLGEWGRAVVEHHERFDGTGYPHGLRGDEISRAARMVTVADCYEVMTGPRTYKRPMSVVSARAELVHVAGSQLDPAVVRALLNVSIGRLWRVVGLGAWLAQAPLLHRLFSNAGTWLAPGVAATATAAVLLAGGLSGATPTPTVALAGPVTYAPGLATAAPPGRPPASDRDSPPAGLSGTPTAPVASAPVASAPAATSTARSGASGAAVAPVHAPGLDSSAAGPCTTHCVGNNNADCVSYCTGNYNTACTASCTGNNDEACVRDCHGNNDINCVSACSQSAPSTARRPVVPSSAVRF